MAKPIGAPPATALPMVLSVNDRIPDSKGSIKYKLIQDAFDVVKASRHSSLLARLNFKDAFCHILVWPANWHLLGFTWQQEFYYDIVSGFSLKSALYIFNLFTEALYWIISQHVLGSLKHCLDNFLAIFSPLTPISVASTAVDWIQGLRVALRLTFQDEKTL
ncbi:hypothetical protein FRB96_008147 [Tulasnella sp. 330]|nr:hypothetical protein FRB96_008147 [Tulasnella sp. 330]